MKKLYRKGTVHPSPPIFSGHLSFLPATMLVLAVALSSEDREVLAYLISCSNSSVNFSSGYHPSFFNCYCSRCYMSYWAKWDSSPKRQVIHEIIDGFEDELLATQSKLGSKNGRKERRKRGGGGYELGELKLSSGKDELGESESAKEDSTGGDHRGSGECAGKEESSIRSFVSFNGERIWGVWTQYIYKYIQKIMEGGLISSLFSF
ncbi:hypothetical protein UlMin_033795 [Ulmus minor]